jgi:orotate phosphoribosyltransferase
MESGHHSDQWWDLDTFVADEAASGSYCAELENRLIKYDVDCICGPATGGAVLAARIGAHLGIAPVSTLRLEKPVKPGLFPVRYELAEQDKASVKGRRVAIVDDAIRAGSAVRGTHEALIACAARPVVIGALLVLGDSAAKLATERGLPLEGVVKVSFDFWKPDVCPLCRAGVPLQKVPPGY